MDATMSRRLAGMMALIYAAQGAWWPLLTLHLRDLGVDGEARGWIFSTLALGSIAMPLGAGHLVDRLLPTQRFLTASFGLGALVLASVALGVTDRAFPLFLLFLAYWLISAPSYSLSNALAFRHLASPAEEFGGIRLWGTVGWMASGWLVSVVMAWSGSGRAGGGASEAFAIGACLSAVMAAYSLTLPHTPPLATGDRSRGVGEGLKVVVQRPEVATYLIATFGVSLTTPFVYQVMPNYLEAEGLPRSWVATAMTLGQWPEILALGILPRLIRTIGYRGTLALGLVAWVARYGTLACDPPLWAALAGIPLHGVGVACVVVVGQVFIDSRAPGDRRASVQALNTMLTSGLGSFLGSLLAGHSTRWFGIDSGAVFLVPCLLNGVLLLYVYLGFHPESCSTGRDRPAYATRSSAREGTRGAVVRVGNLATESADG